MARTGRSALHCFSWFHVNHIGVGNAWRVAGVDNEWDRDVVLKQALGVPKSVFTARWVFLQKKSTTTGMTGNDPAQTSS